MRIQAFEEGGRLHLKVKDDGAGPASDGGQCGSTGLGLKNVCDRLLARYGAGAGCFHGSDPAGGYMVHVIMPVKRNG